MARDGGIAALTIGVLHYYADVPPARPGRSGYVERVVRRIAPAAGLLGREADIAAMRAFCEEPDPYLWWRAGAWAGKSALMSWFVLDPPLGAVAVSFFVTARDATQDDSLAFMTEVLGQLEELLGGDLSELAVADGLAGRFRLMLIQTARHLHARGRRLVLVVDGLDEDRSLEAGLPSIASLLPEHCPHGLKVLVASRPDPRVPADVAARHPLREPRFARTLSRSAVVGGIRAAAETELHGLLTGTPLQREVLGLVTAGRAGLTVRELADLTGQPADDVRSVFAGVTGRTFTTRADDWAAGDDANPVYLLGHETLQQQAADAFGPEHLDGFRRRLHGWAGRYRAAGWPQDTPAYLLYGYFGMLQVTGDTARLIACALDQSRHDRMLAWTGADAAGLAEIAAVTDAILGQAAPDLTALACLAVHRGDLADRNRHVPVGLAAVWVRAGQPGRAEALAGSFVDPVERAEALALVSSALAGAGLPERAAVVAGRADAVARAVTEPGDRASVHAAVAKLLAAAGLRDQAAAVAGRAEAAARTLPDPGGRALHLARAAEALAIAGLGDRAAAAAQEAAAAPSMTNLGDQASTVRLAARALAAAGRADQAAATARSVGDKETRAVALAAVADALSAAGLLDQAEAVGRAITQRYSRAEALASVAEALARAGLRDRALAAAEAATAAFARSGYPWFGGRILPGVVRALVIAGAPDRAEALARSIDGDPASLAQVLAAVAAAHADGPAGPTGQAASLAEEAEALADAAARSEPDYNPGARTTLLTAVAAALAGGWPRRAAALASRAEFFARSAPPARRDDRLAAVGEALAAAGQHDRAETVALAITNWAERAQTLIAVARELSLAGKPDHATRVYALAESAARSTNHNETIAVYLGKIAGQMAAAGQYDEAGATARSIRRPGFYGGLLDVTRAMAAGAQYDRAHALARTITDDATRAEALAQVAEALAATGQQARAAALAREAHATARSLDRRAWSSRLVKQYRSERDYQLKAKTRAYVAAASGLAAAGLPGPAAEAASRAEALVRSVSEHDLHRGDAYASASRALALAGLYDRAEALATANRQQWQHVAAQTEVARVLAAAGQHDRAEALARSITGRRDQAAALALVTEDLAHAGLVDRAHLLASSITDPAAQSRALTALARALAAAGQPERSQRMVALALATGSWTAPLPLLPPEALLAVTDMLLPADSRPALRIEDHQDH